MMHAAFDSNRYSFAIKFRLREQMPQAGPDDNRTLDLINSSRAADRIRQNLFPPGTVFM
jgi:hypothetical protein